MATIEFLNPDLLPSVSTFLFVFALVFGLLSYSKVGEFSKKVNALLALAIALFATLYEPLVSTLNNYIPIAAAGLIILFFVALVKKLFEGKPGKATDTYPLLVSLVILLLLLVAFGKTFALFIPSSLDPAVVLWVIGIIIVLLFFWGIYKYKGSAAAPAGRTE